MQGSLSKIHADAIAAHKGGDLASAEKGYLTLLTAKPDAAEIHYLLGAVYSQNEHLEKAADALRACIRYQPRHAAAINMLGTVLARLGQDNDAIEALGKAAALAPDDHKILYNFAKACIDGKRFDLGADALAKFLELTPNHPEAMNGYATCLAETGQPDKSIATLEKCIESGIATTEIFKNLIQRLIDVKRYDDALKQIHASKSQWPGDGTLLLLHATVLQRMHRNDEALEIYESLVAAEPNNGKILNMLSSFLYDIGQWQDAESYARQALVVSPKSIVTLTNLGRIRQQLGDFDGAELLYEKALQIDPNHADAHNNLGNLLLYKAQTDRALDHLDRAVDLKPESKGFRFNRSVTVLTKGQINSAWRDHRARFEKENAPSGHHWPWPEWNGERLDGRRVLLWGEQGVGDQIIHARAAPLVADRAESCTLECAQRLSTLFERSFPDIEVKAVSTPPDQRLTVGPFDFHCSTLDMNCSLYDTPADISPRPYLRANPDTTSSLRKKYHSTLGDRPLIGVSWWSGYSHHAHFKSIALSRWQDILTTPDAAFVSLQYGEGRDEVAPLQTETGLDLFQDPDVDPLGDLDLFAAQVAAMDLVITISNTTAHMAGGLGVPVWNLTPAGPARLWYWFLEGDTSPWYESMRLFRHTYDESWDGVLNEVSTLLKKTLPDLVSPAP